MVSIDDNKGGSYHKGPFDWPNGFPIASPEEVEENIKRLPVIREVNKATERIILENIKSEFPEIDEKKAAELAKNARNSIG